MKNQILVFICLITMLSFISTLKNTIKEENSIESVAYSVAKIKTDENYNLHSSNYKLPEYVDKLPQRKQLRGEISTIEEIKTNPDYYDGQLKMGEDKNSMKKTSCGEWTTQPEACKKVGNCGWCSSSNSCIAGNEKGPLMPCKAGAFKFETPPENWNVYPKGTEINVTSQIVGKDEKEIFTITPKN